ncbi:DUF309 domain-containing protein [Sulfurovum sp. NBC37-1]|uniref:DUF309 domain-containing protein n=1 Tax=Sulfurovum sp. (strain NBC37-1) TaxID=387093 RepID=UPI0001587887|nr:DUF309 domain-containing protein [Sulfurovum sp. NBC37-1]BAF71076.1 conserved hypothetical protein [Sulfurovum sp. NBC37-1]
MLSMNEDLEGALKQYIILLDKGEYFDAHEVLEEAWHPLRLNKDPLANLTKGLINGAVAFEHLKRNKSNASEKARKVMTSYEKHKEIYSDEIRYAILFKAACIKIEELKSAYPEVWC